MGIDTTFFAPFSLTPRRSRIRSTAFPVTDRLHLPARYRAQLDALFREHLPNVEVWAYGSRVDGRSHDGSDLDLVLRGPGLEEIDLARLDDFMRFCNIVEAPKIQRGLLA